jgi:plasmid stabilization system protein ParE
MPRAERDLATIYARIEAPSSEAAFNWYRGLKAAIETLRENPRRCASIPEKRELRQLLYGNKPHVYRVIYRFSEKPRVVDILHIRHGAMVKF